MVCSGAVRVQYATMSRSDRCLPDPLAVRVGSIKFSISWLYANLMAVVAQPVDTCTLL